MMINHEEISRVVNQKFEKISLRQIRQTFQICHSFNHVNASNNRKSQTTRNVFNKQLHSNLFYRVSQIYPNSTLIIFEARTFIKLIKRR